MNLRKIDILIAEYVFGYEIKESEDFGYYYVPFDDGVYTHRFLPHYTTDTATALKVVEKLRGEYLWFIEAGSQGFTVDLYKGMASVAGEIFADTLPMAICKAVLALQALGVELPK